MIALPQPDDWEAVRRFDEAVDRAFDHLRGRKPVDRVMYAASELGDFSLIWHLLGAAQGTAAQWESFVGSSGCTTHADVSPDLGLPLSVRPHRPRAGDGCPRGGSRLGRRVRALLARPGAPR